MLHIGWIGLGNMGVPMASNLIKAGFPVTLYNRTKEKAEPLTAMGASLAENPYHLLEQCDVIISMVSDDDAVKELYLGANGLLNGLTPNSRTRIFVDMSTVSPETSRLVAAECAARGVSFLDAPVSGSVQPAKEGKLVILVGGDRTAYETVKPVFDVLGKLSLHLGDNGFGSKAKLAINLFLAITAQGIAETVLFARQMGISTEDMLTIITESAMGSPLARMKAPFILADEFPAAFALKHMAKDLRLAKGEGLDLPLGESVWASYQKALQEGFGDKDLMAILHSLEGKGKGNGNQH